ncbi:hypothetical protein EF808_05470, partial [archaeon]
ETTAPPTTTAAPTTAPPTTTAAPTTAPPTTTAAPTTAPPTTAPPYRDVKEIGASDAIADFKVTLESAGYFTHPKFGTAGPQTEHFRVDLTIENLLNGRHSIYPNINCYIVDDQNVRWPVYFVGSPTALSGEYSAKETREGYVVFEEINEESSTQMLTIEIPTPNLPVKIEIPFTYP